jgi:hypothetical protein
LGFPILDAYVRIDGALGGRDFFFGIAYVRIDGTLESRNFYFGIAYIRIDGA